MTNPNNITTWMNILGEAMADAHDPGPVIFYAPNKTTFDEQFDRDNGWNSGPAVLAWTHINVYFPMESEDGYLWLGAAPRNPCWQGQRPQGYIINIQR